MYYVYVIRNRKTGKPYLGYSRDLRRRFREHGGKDPQLIYYEAYRSERDARERERKLKQRGQGIRWLKERLKYSMESE